MERIVYIRGKFKGNNKKMKEAYFYAKEMMTKYDLKPQYMGVGAEEGWNEVKILTIKRKEKKLLEDLEKGKEIKNIELYTKEIEEKQIIYDKSYFSIDKERSIIVFWSNTNIEEIDFKDIKLIKTGGSHGTVEMYAEDWFTEISGDAMGIIFQAEGEKTVYFVGDTIWTADVNKALNRFKPEIIVMNTGAARVLVFKEAIIMGKEDVEHMVKAMPNSQIVAVHLDSVNHATVTRKDLREFIKAKNIEKNIIVPEDGEIIKF